MADTITHTWQTVEQAAVTLNCSTRTIARRIAGGSIESRVDENGRRLVLVETFGAAGSGDDLLADRQTADVGYNLNDNALAVASSASLRTPVSNEAGYSPAATSVLAVLQSTIDAARTDAARARIGARWAWACVGAMAVVIGATALFLTGRLTSAETKVEMLQGDVAAARSDLASSRNDLMIVSSAKAVADQRREVAEQQAVDAEGKQQQIQAQFAQIVVARQQEEAAKPTAIVQKIEKTPSTQPAALFGKFVNLPIEPDGR